MPINSIESAVKYSEELDRVFTQKSATGFFADNALATKFVGAKTVMIPNISFDGLADYDREAGFRKGSINVSNNTYTMQMDRARSLQIDREDMDETGIANLAGKVMGEYVRTKVVPECDAYVISKLASISAAQGNSIQIENEAENPLEGLLGLINSVQGVVGCDEELVAFLNIDVYNAIQNSNEIAKMIIVSDFKQGEVTTKIKTLNGVALIPVVNDRMRTAFDFRENGYSAAEDSNIVNALVCPKNAIHLVKKTEQIRVFTPEQNVDADAYKFDYRIYYDVFVPESAKNSIFVWIGPDASINLRGDSFSNLLGGNVVITTSSSSDEPRTFSWYSCEDMNYTGAKKIPGQTLDGYDFTPSEVGTSYYFCEMRTGIAERLRTEVATVVITP